MMPDSNEEGLPYITNYSRDVMLRRDFPEKIERWTSRWKYNFVLAVRKELFTIEEIIELYGISPEEFQRWEWELGHHSIDGLKATRIQKHRGRNERLRIEQKNLPISVSSLVDKVAILEAIRAGTISAEHVCSRYQVTSSDLDAWKKYLQDLNTSCRLTRHFVPA